MKLLSSSKKHVFHSNNSYETSNTLVQIFRYRATRPPTFTMKAYNQQRWDKIPHTYVDLPYDFFLKCIKQFFCCMLSRIYSVSFSSLHLLPSAIWTHCVYIWNFSCYSTCKLPHKKCVFVYYSISVGLLLVYVGAIVLKLAKQTQFKWRGCLAGTWMFEE